ncbi:hypothetical protein Tco_1202746 [Tanacetum coccineum]
MCNFVGRAKNVHMLVGCFIYVVNFMILENLGNVIDGRLSEVVLGKPFVNASKLAYDKTLGSIRFAHRNNEVVFRMPQRTKELDLISPLEKDKFEAFFMGTLGRHLEEIHVTWAQFWKKLDKMAIWLEDGLKNQDQGVETASGKLVTPFETHSDDVWIIVTPSGSAS